MAYSYIIESEKNGSWYYGSTADIERRLLEHNSGQTLSTKNRGSWKLIFKREFNDRSEALAFELELKKLKNKSYIKRIYTQYFLT